MRLFLDFLFREEAATAVEYAVMLALIIISLIGAISAVGTETGGMWGGVQSDLDSVGFGRK